VKPLSGKEFSRLLEREGWVLRRVHGSHHIYGREGSVVRLSVPVHDNRMLKAVLQHHLMKSAGLVEASP
jgi:predicted RNA binding protein YcfA (HicA-like mRNA interferase family)